MKHDRSWNLQGQSFSDELILNGRQLQPWKQTLLTADWPIGSRSTSRFQVRVQIVAQLTGSLPIRFGLDCHSQAIEHHRAVPERVRVVGGNQNCFVEEIESFVKLTPASLLERVGVPSRCEPGVSSGDLNCIMPTSYSDVWISAVADGFQSRARTLLTSPGPYITGLSAPNSAPTQYSRLVSFTVASVL